MKSKRLGILLLSIILISIFLPFFNPVQATPIPPHNRNENPILFFIDKILAQFFILIGWYNIGSGLAPKYFFAEPAIVELGYLENKSIDIFFGNPLRNASGYQESIFYEVDLLFEAEFPPHIQTDAFTAYFDPPRLDLSEYADSEEAQGRTGFAVNEPKTTLYLKLEIPPDPNNPIEDFELKVNVSIIRKYKNMWETNAFGWLKAIIPDTRIKLGTRISSLAFVQAFSTTSVGNKNCTLFVKQKPFRYAELSIIGTQPIKMSLNDIKTTQLRVENRGNYVEQYGFRIKGANGSLVINQPSPITLYPGEQKITQVGLITKPVYYDRGTLHNIDIELYPYDSPNETLAVSTLSVKTQGFALQSIFRFRFSWHIFFAITTIIFLIIIFGIYRRIRIRKLKQKPKKPWTLPDKKHHLEQLLKENKKQQYSTEIIQLKEEYKIELKNHKKEIKNELKKQRKQSILYRPFYKLISLLKSPLRDSGKKEKVKINIPKKKRIKTIDVKKPIKKKKITKKKSTNNIPVSTDSQKQQLLDKIKKQQQKVS